MTKKVNALLIALFMGGGALYAQEHEIYSVLVLNFTKHVQWPDHDVAGEFVIGVIGNTKVYNTLDAWYSGKQRGAKTYVIKKFADASQVTDCHVLFIDKKKSAEFSEVSEK